MWTKKEIHKYKNIYNIYSTQLDNSVEKEILLKQLEILIEKMKSIEILYNEKMYCSLKTIIRPILESIANLNFILSESELIKIRCVYFHIWSFQNEFYKYNKYINQASKELKSELENEVNSLLNEFNYNEDRTLFLKEITDIRNSYNNSESNKKYWFNLNTNLKGIEEFLEKYIGFEAIFLYKK